MRGEFEAIGSRVGASRRLSLPLSFLSDLIFFMDHQIDLYYQHRVDPKVPVEETMAALKELQEEGKVCCSSSSSFLKLPYHLALRVD